MILEINQRLENLRKSSVLNQTAEVPIIRKKMVKSGQVFEAVLQLNKYLKNPDKYADVETWHVDDSVLRGSWLSQLHLNIRKWVRK